MAAGGEFEWRPGAPRRKRSALLAVPVLAACAAAGASCGSGQQHPFRAPQRVQSIAFEIVSSGVGDHTRHHHDLAVFVCSASPLRS
jgi:hypothetical protein